MTKPRAHPSLERRVLAAFDQAYAEQAYEVADRLLATLEFMERHPKKQRSDRGTGSTVRDAYQVIASEAVPPDRKQ